MTAILTSKGLDHLAELEAGDVPTESFDGLVFGRGNDEPTDTPGDPATLDEVTQRLTSILLRVSDGYPKKNDDDSRNVGRGASTWTWKFERGAGTAFVASNVALTNHSGGALIANAPLAFHAKPEEALGPRLDERYIVFVNLTASLGSAGATVYTAVEQALENRIQRVEGFAARNRSLGGYPNASVVDSTTVKTRPQIGQHVWTAAHVVGREGRPLQPGDVETFHVVAEKYVASEGVYVPFIPTNTLECGEHVFGALVKYDDRYIGPEGYNVSHTFIPPRGSREKTYRLTYRMRLCDRDIREWTNIVECS